MKALQVHAHTLARIRRATPKAAVREHRLQGEPRKKRASREKWSGTFFELAERVRRDVLALMVQGFDGSAADFTAEIRRRGLIVSNAAMQKAWTMLYGTGAFHIVRMQRGSRLVAGEPGSSPQPVNDEFVDAVANRVAAILERRGQS